MHQHIFFPGRRFSHLLALQPNPPHQLTPLLILQEVLATPVLTLKPNQLLSTKLWGQKSQSITIHALLARQVLLKTAETERYLQESGTMECSDHVSQ